MGVSCSLYLLSQKNLTLTLCLFLPFSHCLSHFQVIYSMSLSFEDELGFPLIHLMGGLVASCLLLDQTKTEYGRSFATLYCRPNDRSSTKRGACIQSGDLGCLLYRLPSGTSGSWHSRGFHPFEKPWTSCLLLDQKGLISLCLSPFIMPQVILNRAGYLHPSDGFRMATGCLR